MLKLITVSQMRDADSDFIETNQLSSADLMEKAATAFTGVFCNLVPEKTRSILIVCGTGNNGGDGLAIARILQCAGYSNLRVLIVKTGLRESKDFLVNLQRLDHSPVRVEYWESDGLPDIKEQVVIDAILGSGLDRRIEGALSGLIDSINNSGKHVVAVDCPTGFRCEGEFIEGEPVLKAKHVISFQRPKINFFFPESARFFECFYVVDVGLREEFIESLPSDFNMISAQDISRIYKKRANFSHKGTYGHAFIWAGSIGKSGAALLCAEACVFSGAGLTSVCLPEEDRLALHSRVPEAMFLGSLPAFSGDALTGVTAVAVGPGLSPDLGLAIDRFIEEVPTPLVVDAEALNHLGRRPELLKKFRSDSVILTPHMKEFDRMFRTSGSWWARLQLAIVKAKELKLTIVLKNRYTFIVLPDGRVLINPTGNPAMASGGMGDVLTGMIVSFLAQGYNSEEACILACYIHGRAGDVLAAAGSAVVPASQLIAKLPQVIGEAG